NGNFVSTLTPEMAGTDARLKALEPVFHQDLNGDGAVGAAPLAAADGSFVFNQSAGGTISSGSSELPDTMPAPANAQEQGTVTDAAGSHSTAVIDSLIDFLHNLHDTGFMLG